MICVNCKYCIGFEDGYYICQGPFGESEYIDEYVANDANIGCDLYVEDMDDDN